MVTSAVKEVVLSWKHAIYWHTESWLKCLAGRCHSWYALLRHWNVLLSKVLSHFWLLLEEGETTFLPRHLALLRQVGHSVYYVIILSPTSSSSTILSLWNLPKKNKSGLWDSFSILTLESHSLNVLCVKWVDLRMKCFWGPFPLSATTYTNQVAAGGRTWHGTGPMSLAGDQQSVAFAASMLLII